ncbi:hypothetical protein ACJX0J_030372 [Zea mays]
MSIQVFSVLEKTTIYLVQNDYNMHVIMFLALRRPAYFIFLNLVHETYNLEITEAIVVVCCALMLVSIEEKWMENILAAIVALLLLLYSTFYEVFIHMLDLLEMIDQFVVGLFLLVFHIGAAWLGYFALEKIIYGSICWGPSSFEGPQKHI